MTEAPSVTATPPGRPSWIALRAHPASAAIARRFAQDVLADHPFDLYDAALVASELVSNAIRHARTSARRADWPIRLEITIRDGHAHISVTDHDPRPLAPVRRSGTGGRGLAIVDAHTTGRTVTYGVNAKTITACLPARIGST